MKVRTKFNMLIAHQEAELFNPQVVTAPQKLETTITEDLKATQEECCNLRG